MTPAAPVLSRTRTVVLWGLLLVWICEATITNVRPLSEWWTHAWKMSTPDDARLATALYLTHAFEGAAKGALAVLAVFALRSNSASVRAALFVPMALVPPLNLAFIGREQGFLPGPTTIAATLSLILWGTFFLFREQGEERNTEAERAPSPAGVNSIWFVANAVVLTLAASVLLFAPDTALELAFPCFSDAFHRSGASPSALKLTALADGSHFTAVAAATWVGALYGRRSPTVRTAVSLANTVFAGLLCFIPLARLAVDVGRECATKSILIYAVPLFVGWLSYDVLSYGALSSRRVRPAPAD